MPTRHIVAGSAGFLSTDRNAFQWRFGPVIRYVLALTGKPRPKLCFIGTATGDSVLQISGFYGAASGESVDASHLQLYAMPNADPERHLLSQDAIWVGGGSVVNLLAVWRAHGVDAILRRAWEQGIVLAGVSAGSICWHVGGTTDSFGPELQPVTNALGWLPFSNAVHYDTEPGRRPLFQQLIATGALPAGYATDDGVATHYVDTSVQAIVADRPGTYAYWVSRDPGNTAVEQRLEPELLDQSAPEPST